VSDGVTLRSHRVVDGVIQFDNANSFSAGVSINQTNLKSALDYLSKNFNKSNHWGDSVIFEYTNTVNPVLSGTFVYTEGGTSATTSIKDTLVLLQGITGLTDASLIAIV